MSTKFDKLDDALKRLVRNIENSPKDYTLLATKYAEGIFKQRVFNASGAKDINGAIVAQYSEGYRKYNKWGKKKTTSNWDLHAEGDLRDNIKVVTTTPKKKTVLMFTSEKEIKKANGLEERSGKTIFEISKKEREEILNYIAKTMLRDIKKIVKESFK